jgi:hypothetical protein
VAGGQVQIIRQGPTDAPVTYRLPATAPCIPIAVNANYDGSGAAGDYIPAVVLVGASGTVIARAADPAVTITAGDDAEVSFFPGVKNSASTAASLTRAVQFSYTVIGQVIPSGVATTITFDAGAVYTATSRPLAGAGAGPFTVTGVHDFDVTCGLVVQWPAGAYDRYIEIVQPTFFTSGAPITWRQRGAATPDEDIQTVFATLEGLESAPEAVQFNCFQASGANQTIQRWLTAATIPYLRPPGVNF